MPSSPRVAIVDRPYDGGGPKPVTGPETNIVGRTPNLVAKCKWPCYVPAIMETLVSFAPLAARLAARAAEMRPAPGARNDWDKIGALVVCLVLEMLICLCEALDARAAAEARAVAALAPSDVKTAFVQAPRAARQAPSSERRALRLAVVPEIDATTPKRADAPSGTTGRPAPATPRLVWSRDPGPGRPCPALATASRNGAFPPAIKHAYIVTTP